LIHPIVIKTYGRSRAQDPTLEKNFIGCLGGNLSRVRAIAITSRAKLRPALARTPLWNPTEPWNRRLSMMGCSIPPKDEPEAAIPKAKVRRCLKY
jgi:hypothetical protein